MPKNELVSKLLSRDTLTRAALALTVVSLATACAAPAVGQGRAPVVPRATDASLPRVFESDMVVPPEQGQLISAEVEKLFGPKGTAVEQAVVEMMPDLSPAALEVVQLNGLRAVQLETPLMVEGKDGVLSSEVGWFRLIRRSIHAEKHKVTQLLFNPRTGQMMKIFDSSIDPLLVAGDAEAYTASFSQVGDSEKVALRTIMQNGTPSLAIEFPYEGESAMRLLPKLPASQQLLLKQQAYAEMVEMLRKGYIHWEPHMKNWVIKTMPDGTLRPVWIDWWSVNKISPRDLAAYWNTLLPWSWFRFSSLSLLSSQEQRLGSAKFLQSVGRSDLLLPPPADKTGLTIAPTVVALAANNSRIPLLKGGQQVGEIQFGNSLPAAAADDVIDAEYTILSGGEKMSARVVRFANSAASMSARIILPLLEGTAYIVAADTLLKTINPAENGEETMGITYSDEARISNYQTELTSQKKIRRIV